MQKNNSNDLTLYQRGTDWVQVRLNPDQFPRLKNITTDYGTDRIRQMAYAACVLRGVKAEEVQLDLTAAALWDEIRADFPELTMDEVGLAIKNGTYEKYGDVYGINAVSLYKMVAAYVGSEERKELNRRVREAKERKTETQAALNAQFLANNPNYKRSTL